MLQAAIALTVDLASEYREFASLVPDHAFATDLGERSTTIGAQLWCVVGARESHTKAIHAGEWVGFACSLDDIHDPDRVVEALEASERGLLGALSAITDWTDERKRLLLDLLAHEAQHQGQLIRYGYALGLRFPSSWARRWSLGG